MVSSERRGDQAGYAPADPADRIVYHPGDQVQCDLWFPEPKIPLSDGTLVMLPVLVMVASFSKYPGDAPPATGR